MKKTTLSIVAMVISVSVTGAVAYPVDVAYGADEPYYPDYQNAKFISENSIKNLYDFYLGIRFAYNMASFSNQYSLASDPFDSETESFSLVPQIGFDMSLGYRFAPKWRAELNYGETGTFDDHDSGATFSLSSQYLTVNAIYTLARWGATSIYGGAGLGLAFVEVTDAGPVFTNDGNDSQTETTFATQLIAGLEQDISNNFSIHIQYRLMYTGGQSHSRGVTGDIFINDVSNIWTNSLMVGARLKF